MTDYTPSIKIYIDSVEQTAKVDYSLNYYAGQAWPWDFPGAGSGSLTLLYLDTPAMDAAIGSKVEITEADATAAGAYRTLITAWVTDISVNYRATGPAGSIVEVHLTIVGGLGKLIGRNYITGASGTSAGAFAQIIGSANRVTWDSAPPTALWSDVGGTVTWDTYDQSLSSYVYSYASGSGYNVSFAAGTRDVMGDLQTLFSGCHAILIEDNTGALDFQVNPTVFLAMPSLTTDVLATDIRAEVNRSQLRNYVTVDTQVGSKGASISQFGILDGSVTTALTSSTDALNIAQLMADTMSTATVAIRQFSLDLLNPNLTDNQRNRYMEGPYYYNAATISGLPAVFGSTDLLLWGCSWEINRNAFRVTYDCTPRSMFAPTNTWQNVSNTYTWTSYGTAYPTQIWSDL